MATVITTSCITLRISRIFNILLLSLIVRPEYDGTG